MYPKILWVDSRSGISGMARFLVRLSRTFACSTRLIVYGMFHFHESGIEKVKSTDFDSLTARITACSFFITLEPVPKERIIDACVIFLVELNAEAVIVVVSPG